MVLSCILLVAVNMADDNSVSSESSGFSVEPRTVRTKIKTEPCCQSKARKFSVTFEKFRFLPSKKNQGVPSSKFLCFGHEWRLQLFAGGYTTWTHKPLKGTVGVCVERCNRSGKWPDVKISFEVHTTTGNTSIQMSEDKRRVFEGMSDLCDITTRSDIKRRFLDDEGALTISVIMELKEFIPKNPFATTMLKLFGDEESSDVVFEVCNQDKEKNTKKRKRQKASTVQFHAHRFILAHTSSELAALCESSPEGGLTSPILINDIKPDVFGRLLHYVYGGDDIEEKFFIDNGKEIIYAADKLGVVNLKLEAEVWYVHSTKLTTENVIDNLLYADAMNLALLKEAVMDYIVKNKKKVIKRVSFEAVPGDIYKDLLAAVSRVLEDSDEDDSDDEDENEEKDDYASMGIGALRQKLDERGIDIDGSRDTLIAALKQHS